MIPSGVRVDIDIAPAVPRRAEALALFVPRDGAPADADLARIPAQARDAVRRVLRSLCRGKAGEVAFALAGNTSIALVGVGELAKVTPDIVRQAAGSLARSMRKHRVRSAAIVLPAIGSLDAEAIVNAIVTGCLLASFKFEECKGTATRKKQREENGEQGAVQITLVTPDARRLRPALERARILADAQNLARAVAWRPGNQINPPSLARLCQEMARETGLKCRVLDDKQLEKLGMGGILGVGAGSSATPPRLIALEYHPTSRRKAPPLLVVGKAITFDTGGISIKPAEKMGKMIFDKCGAMAVLGLMHALSRLKPDIPVVGLLSSAENHISEKAYRPGDVLRLYNGVTVEVTNTDAEGRLVLADALAWGIEEYKPAATLDLATLTGGVVVALGKTIAGVMANNDALFAEIQQAADLAAEKIWRLPLGDDQRDLLKSDPADIVNSGPREAHPLQGGAFLSYFVPETMPWAHLDIAGVADTDKELPYHPRGATGWGVRTLVEWVCRRADRI